LNSPIDWATHALTAQTLPTTTGSGVKGGSKVTKTLGKIDRNGKTDADERGNVETLPFASRGQLETRVKLSDVFRILEKAKHLRI